MSKNKKKTPRKNATSSNEKFPHFRYYVKSKHPALIIGEQPVEEYRYRKVRAVPGIAVYF